MNKRRNLCILSVITLIIVIIAVIILHKNRELAKNKIKIIDATYHSENSINTCNNALEKIYEDEYHIYYLICAKSEAVFVKFPNNTKMLVTKALNEGKTTIEEVIDAGLKVKIENK